jgi:hypothetical protein
MKVRKIMGWGAVVGVSVFCVGWCGWQLMEMHARAVAAEQAIFAANEAQKKARADDFAWFDGLGYPDVKDKPFVRVITSYGSEPGYSYGWLLREEPGGLYEVFGVDLSQTLYQPRPQQPLATKTQARVPEFDLKYEKTDLVAYAEQWLAKRKKEKQEEGPERRGWSTRQLGWNVNLTAGGEAFVLARRVAEQGHQRLAEELYDLSSDFKPGQARPEEGPGYRRALLNAIAHAAMLDGVSWLADKRRSRAQIQARYEMFSKGMAQSDRGGRLAEMAAVLTRMVEQEKARSREGAKEGSKDLNKMTGQEKARELIFGLRDQDELNGWRLPDQVGVFLSGYPSQDLQALGFDAVPALIEALDDDGLTRAVPRSFKAQWRPDEPYRVGDLADRVLGAIAMRTFQGVHNGTWAERARDRKQIAQAWWTQVQEKGLREVLIETVAAGEQSAGSQAQYLMKQYPDVDVLELLKKGFKRARDVWGRNELVKVAGRIKTPEAAAWLNELIVSYPDTETRLAAASALLETDKRRAVDAMILEWKKEPADWRSLARFLAEVEDEAAVRALAHGMELRKDDVQYEVLRALDPKAFRTISDPKVNAVREMLLLERVGDTHRMYGYGSFNSDPKMGELAAQALAGGWPEKYKFNARGTQWERERDRTVIVNGWLTRQGKPEIPLPEKPAAKTAGLSAPLASQAAQVVQRVELEEDSAPLTEPVMKLLKGMEGKRLTGKAFVEVIAAYAKSPSEATRGIWLLARRDEPETGFVIRVKLFTKVTRLGKGTESNQWNGYATVEAEPVRYNAAWNSAGDHQSIMEKNKRFIETVEKAMELPADQQVSARVMMTREGM